MVTMSSLTSLHRKILLELKAVLSNHMLSLRMRCGTCLVIMLLHSFLREFLESMHQLLLALVNMIPMNV